MNSMIKENGRYNVVNEAGTVIAFIEKYGIGTHGHYRGYQHHVFCPELGELLWAGVADHVVHPGSERPWNNWSDAPAHFVNLKEARAYYGIPEKSART